MNLLQKIIDALWPAFCVFCEKPIKEKEEKEHLLCGDCSRGLPVSRNLACAVCGARLPENKKICHRFASYLLAAPFAYNFEPAKKVIWDLKYGKKKVLARPLGRLLASHLSFLPKMDFTDWLIVPIPLHPAKEQQRGFNQAALLAEHLGRQLNLPVADALKRIKETKAQAETKERAERLENLQGAFAVVRPELVAKRKIILVDDVSTTGVTLAEAAKTLRKAGAKSVLGLAVAKAK